MSSLITPTEFAKIVIKYICSELDGSGSTAGPVFRKECYWATRICYEFGNEVTRTFGVWDTIASPKVFDDVKNLTPMNGGTDPSCITKNAIHMNSIKQSDLFIFVTDGSIDSSSVKRASESFGNTLADKIVIAIIVGGRFNPDKVNVSTVLPIISKSEHYVVLYSDYNTDYMRVLISEGAFDYTINNSPNNTECDYPKFDVERLSKMSFNINKKTTNSSTINIAPGVSLNTNILGASYTLDDLDVVSDNFDRILLHFHTIGKLDTLSAFLQKAIKDLRRNEIIDTSGSENDVKINEIDILVRRLYDCEDESEKLALRLTIAELNKTSIKSIKSIRSDNRELIAKLSGMITRVSNMSSTNNMLLSSINSNRVGRAKVVSNVNNEPNFAGTPLRECGILFVETDVCLLLAKSDEKYDSNNKLNFPLAAGVTMGLCVLPIVIGYDVAKKLTRCPITRKIIYGILPICDLSKEVNMQIYRYVLGKVFMENKDLSHVLTMFLAGLTSRVPEWITSNAVLSDAVNYVRTQLYNNIKVPEYLDSTVSTKFVSLLDAIKMLPGNIDKLMRQPPEAFNIIIKILADLPEFQDAAGIRQIEHFKQIRAAREFVKVASDLQKNPSVFSHLINSLNNCLFDNINDVICFAQTGHLLDDKFLDSISDFDKTTLRRECVTILAMSIFNNSFRYEHIENCINTLMDSDKTGLVRRVFTAPLDVTSSEVCEIINKRLVSPIYVGFGNQFFNTMGISVVYFNYRDVATGTFKKIPFVPEFMEFKTLTNRQINVLNNARKKMFEEIYGAGLTPTSTGKSSNLHKSIMIALSGVKFSTVVTDELVDRVVEILATEKGNPFIPTIKNSIRYSVQSYIDVHIKENGGTPDTFKQWRKYSVQEKWAYEMQNCQF